MNTDPRLTVNKIVYIKRKPFTKEQLSEVLRIEAETHIRKYPDLMFIAIGKPIKNKDLSQTFPIHFGVKPVQPKT